MPDMYSFYTPPAQPGGVGECGRGAEWQVNIQGANGKITVFQDPAKQGRNDWPELEALAQRVNALVDEEGRALLKVKRRELKEPRLEITVWIAEDGMHLVYAKPVGSRQAGSAATAYGKLGAWLRSRFGRAPTAGAPRA